MTSISSVFSTTECDCLEIFYEPRNTWLRYEFDLFILIGRVFCISLLIGFTIEKTLVASSLFVTLLAIKELYFFSSHPQLIYSDYSEKAASELRSWSGDDSSSVSSVSSSSSSRTQSPVNDTIHSFDWDNADVALTAPIATAI
jgi:hypothetical protein